MLSTRAGVALATLAITVAGCSSMSSSTGTAASPTGSATSPSHSVTSPHPSQRPPRTRHTRATTATAPAISPAPTKVLVFMVENHSLAEMQSQMPWTAALAARYGYATSYHAMTHPSLPNYLAIAGGSTFGVLDDGNPSSHPLTGPSVFGEALAHGQTARVYAEDMPGNCVTSPAGEYGVKHNPWAYFVDERAACDRYDVPLTALAADVSAGTLPNAGLVIANMCNIGHDCPLGTADTWLRDHVGPVLAGPDFTSGRLVVVITADEDDSSAGNTVLTVVASHDLPAHQVVTTPLTHLSLSRLYAEVLGFAPLRGAATAPSLAQAFHVPVGG
ncbi:alkaline phosphatase family protein [Nocardioides cynanchi]|uniref:alkaline phosphatase family protein n=1 Tax=Nocardioides cynanchi TaxID=2558918 RepID=UPI001EE17A8C|nr:alkaline phosphatase family protein [Nocardioides cynanchi]